MSRPRVYEATALDAEKEIGLDLEKLKADARSEMVEAHIRQSIALAQAIGITCTPAFIIGDKFFAGLAPVEDLLKAVAATREARGG